MRLLQLRGECIPAACRGDNQDKDHCWMVKYVIVINNMIDLVSKRAA